MQQVNIQFSTTNAAFEDDAGLEAGRILEELARKLSRGAEAGDRFALMDHNGNRVGECTII